MAGNWKEAVLYFEETLLSYAFHFDAMNDLAYIYATYVLGHPKGIEYARRVLVNTPKSAGIDCAVLDTAGWAAYRHAHRLDRAEVHLRKALSYLKPGEQFYPTVAYHLIAVLVDAGKQGEAKRLFETFSHLPVTHLFDEQSIRAARALLGRRGRLRRFFNRIQKLRKHRPWETNSPPLPPNIT
jgi:tetratricopeptide (TPR) repeat protein